MNGDAAFKTAACKAVQAAVADSNGCTITAVTEKVARRLDSMESRSSRALDVYAGERSQSRSLQAALDVDVAYVLTFADSAKATAGATAAAAGSSTFASAFKTAFEAELSTISLITGTTISDVASKGALVGTAPTDTPAPPTTAPG